MKRYYDNYFMVRIFPDYFWLEFSTRRCEFWIRCTQILNLKFFIIGFLISDLVLFLQILIALNSTLTMTGISVLEE